MPRHTRLHETTRQSRGGWHRSVAEIGIDLRKATRLQTPQVVPELTCEDRIVCFHVKGCKHVHKRPVIKVVEIHPDRVIAVSDSNLQFHISKTAAFYEFLVRHDGIPTHDPRYIIEHEMTLEDELIPLSSIREVITKLGVLLHYEVARDGAP